MTKSSESKWRALISEQERSGLSVREFADVHGVTPSTLYWWRSKLKRRQPDLVPVAVVADDPLQSGHVDGFELRIDAALTLRIPSGFDASELRRLLAALRC
jgi:transposase-like protein